MTKDQLLAKLRSDRDEAASRGDHGEALILNDRIRDLKEGGSEVVERVMQEFETALACRKAIWEAIDLGGGQTCDVAGVLRELRRAGFSIVANG